MITGLDTTFLAEVSGLIAERMGLHFPEERWPDLTRDLKNASRELGFEYPDGCVSWLSTREWTTRNIETLASYLTVGETYFFRDPESFEVLKQEILPPLIASRLEAGRTLRLWSAGCCTGEEAYSLAISCARALPNLPTWNVSVLATDINPKFLAKAEAGVYAPWSFRGTSDLFRGNYFSPALDQKLRIDAAVKKLVHFDYLNLADDLYPSFHNHTNAMDVIFCRNVLMYFTPDHQRRVVAAMYRCLVDGGYLVVNPAEASHSLFPMFAMENIRGVVLFHKTSGVTHLGSHLENVLPNPDPPVPAFMASSVPDAPPPESPFYAAALPIVPVSPTAPLHREDILRMSRVYANQGRLEEGLAMCREAIAVESTNPAAYFLCATICDELGRLEEAVAALGKVLYLDQDFILAHHALGGLYKRLGKQRESRRHLVVALELLSARGRDEIVPESDGVTCGRLVESVQAMTGE
jgi:chemotaxis protein methyltransferase CheR